jgi:hypothetical protein
VLVEDPSVIGWYTDNELHWWGSGGYWGSDDQQGGSDSLALVNDYIGLAPDSSGKRRWVRFLEEQYDTIEKLNDRWGTEYASFDCLHFLLNYNARTKELEEDKRDFLRLIAETYFQKTSAALKLYVPNHMNLGTRVVGVSTPQTVLEVMAKYVDVVSFNTYSRVFPKEYLSYLHELTGKPILFTEFCFCAGAADGFVYNTNGANSVMVKDQARRCELYEAFVKEAAGLPYMVGTHWFALYDYGDRKGLIGNYGLLNLADEPWEALMAAMKKTHQELSR